VGFRLGITERVAAGLGWRPWVTRISLHRSGGATETVGR
jgi:hypothetical protein